MASSRDPARVDVVEMIISNTSTQPHRSTNTSKMSSETPDADAAAKGASRTPTSWDASDDILLMHLKDNQKLGWKEIASHFTNRTPNACQFRWRRLKSGNLKNPPKSQTPSQPPAEAKRGSFSEKPRRHDSISHEIPGVYSPIASTTFTGYDTVSNALAGLNALSSTASGSHGSNGPPINTTSHPQTFDNSPKSDLALDPQSHGPAGAAGGYFTDISVDPTSNLPHNKPHPAHRSSGLTPRNSVEHQLPSLHNNSIIQIVRDDRNSVTSQSRHSVSSLPSKSMDIPHHTSNSLAHLPILYGGSSISGAAGSPSISGPSGLPHLASTLSSIRKGSIVGPSQAYLRRSSMHERPLERLERPERPKEKEKGGSEGTTPKGSTPQPLFKIPWSMEEDELLINRRRKELSFAELSILLPQRTEGEIWARIDTLERLRNGHRPSVSRPNRRRGRQSSLGLDDVDDFYDDVDSVIGDMDSEDDNDQVLMDVEESLGQRARKRRASSAVNPLSVREGISGRLH